MDGSFAVKDQPWKTTPTATPAAVAATAAVAIGNKHLGQPRYYIIT